MQHINKVTNQFIFSNSTHSRKWIRWQKARTKSWKLQPAPTTEATYGMAGNAACERPNDMFRTRTDTPSVLGLRKRSSSA